MESNDGVRNFKSKLQNLQKSNLIDNKRNKNQSVDKNLLPIVDIKRRSNDYNINHIETGTSNYLKNVKNYQSDDKNGNLEDNVNIQINNSLKKQNSGNPTKPKSSNY
jgi:hypothetical protein